MGSLFAAGNLLRFIIIVATAIAVILQWVTQYRCNFALYKEDDSTAIGVWFLMTNNECSSEVYDPDESDPFIWTARSCLTIAMICGAIGGLLVALEWCCCEVCCAACFEMSAFMSAWILAALVNLIYACELCTNEGFDTVTVEGIEAGASSDSQCKYGPASTLNAIATILYAACCIFLCCTGAPEPAFQR